MKKRFYSILFYLSPIYIFAQEGLYATMSEAYQLFNELKSTDNPLDFDLKYAKAAQLLTEYWSAVEVFREQERNLPLSAEKRQLKRDIEQLDFNAIAHLSSAMKLLKAQYPNPIVDNYNAARDFIQKAEAGWLQKVDPNLHRYYDLLHYNQIVFTNFNDSLSKRHQSILQLKQQNRLFEFPTLLYDESSDSMLIQMHILRIESAYQAIKNGKSKAEHILKLVDTIEAESDDNQWFIKRVGLVPYLYCKVWGYMQLAQHSDWIAKDDLNQHRADLALAKQYLENMEQKTMMTSDYVLGRYKQLNLNKKELDKLEAALEKYATQKRTIPHYSQQQIATATITKQKLITNLKNFRALAEISPIFLSEQPIKLLVTIDEPCTFSDILVWYRPGDKTMKEAYFIMLKDLNKFALSSNNLANFSEQQPIPKGTTLWLPNPAGMGLFKIKENHWQVIEE
jgi:hypothetical protein